MLRIGRQIVHTTTHSLGYSLRVRVRGVSSQPGSLAAEEIREVTREEVAQHDSEDDCWIIIGDHVYDVTDYIYEHPGGDIIADDAGDDATEGFDEAEHSEEAVEEMAQFLVGKLKS